MALIRKTFYNLTPVEDTSITDIESACVEDFGKLAAKLKKEKADRKEKGYPSLKVEFFIDGYGRFMNINTSNIVWEENIYFSEITEHQIFGALVSYLIEMSEMREGDPIEKDKMEEAFNEITRLFWGGLTLGLKIIKLGNIEYFCYCINREVDEH